MDTNNVIVQLVVLSQDQGLDLVHIQAEVEVHLEAEITEDTEEAAIPEEIESIDHKVIATVNQ